MGPRNHASRDPDSPSLAAVTADESNTGETIARAGRSRRTWLAHALTGGTFAAFGAVCALAPEALVSRAMANPRKDGRARVPPGQYTITRLRAMGGEEGDLRRSTYSLRVHGLVSTPMTLGFKDLLALDNVELELDVHCVTKWTVLGARLTGVRLAELAKLAGVKKEARYVILEGAHGYTANISLREALLPQNLIAHKLEGDPLAAENGAPVRAIIPDLYFWKSAKWLTGIRFVASDEPGYWETRGYHNHADPWLEERYS